MIKTFVLTNSLTSLDRTTMPNYLPNKETLLLDRVSKVAVSVDHTLATNDYMYAIMVSMNFAHAKQVIPTNQFAILQRYFYITVLPYFKYPACAPYCLTKDAQFIKNAVYLNSVMNKIIYVLDHLLPANEGNN